MTPEKFKAKIDAARMLIVEKLVEVEGGPQWGSEEDREDVADALEELSTQATVMCNMLREEE